MKNGSPSHRTRKETGHTAVQLELQLVRGWGGRRQGAGRKPSGRRVGVAHRTRPEHKRRHPVHVTLLENETVILEGVDLREVSAGDYELLCSPLKYDGATGDGAPARTFLRTI